MYINKVAVGIKDWFVSLWHEARSVHYGPIKSGENFFCRHCGEFIQL